jgi:hypothetical protein
MIDLQRQKKKNDQNLDFAGSRLPDDQSLCIQKQFFFCQTAPEHVLWPLLKQKFQFGNFFNDKLPFLRPWRRV